MIYVETVHAPSLQNSVLNLIKSVRDKTFRGEENRPYIVVCPDGQKFLKNLKIKLFKIKRL